MRVCTSCRLVLKADVQQCPADGAATERAIMLPRGALLGRYRIERVIGDGGMGFVYEATHVQLGRRAAIKMLRPEFAKHPQVVTRFLNEARAVNLIGHPNIVEISDYSGDIDGGVYFVMEFLEGQTLDDLIRKRPQMRVPLVLHLFGQIARALTAAHAKQIIHRDLKPANVFVIARDDNPMFIKLLDFGVAKMNVDGAAPMQTLSGAVLGTPQYMSPEQCSGKTADVRADVWAFGVMLYHATTGQLPFKGDNFLQVSHEILTQTPTPADRLVAMPAPLAALIASCLERNVEARCASIAQVLDGLEQVKQASGLDDDAILDAVCNDAALPDSAPARRRDASRVSVAPSLPRYQGVPGPYGAAPSTAHAAPRSRLGLYMAIAATLGALGSGAYAMLGRRAQPVEPPAKVVDKGSGEPVGPGVREPATARARAEQHLRAALGGASQQQQGFAIDAIARANARGHAKLLYPALEGDPEVRKKAAGALCALKISEAAPRVRDAFAAAPEAIKIDLAAHLECLGDPGGSAALRAAVTAPDGGAPATARNRRVAALALARSRGARPDRTATAEGADAAVRKVLGELTADATAGSERWRDATDGLVRLGDADARTRLTGELAQDHARAVPAAALLATTKDPEALRVLAGILDDGASQHRGGAAVALARLGDPRALAWVPAGLDSSAPDERLQALAICGWLSCTAHLPRIGALAAGDPDPRVVMTAEAILLGP